MSRSRQTSNSLRVRASMPLAASITITAEIDRREGAVGVLREVLVARRVEQVEHAAVVFEGHHRGDDRDAALALDRHPVRPGRPPVALGLDLAGELDGAAEQQQLLGQGGLAGIGMGDDRKGAAPIDLGRSRQPDLGGLGGAKRDIHGGLDVAVPAAPIKVAASGRSGTGPARRGRAPWTTAAPGTQIRRAPPRLEGAPPCSPPSIPCTWRSPSRCGIPIFRSNSCMWRWSTASMRRSGCRTPPGAGPFPLVLFASGNGGGGMAAVRDATQNRSWTQEQFLAAGYAVAWMRYRAEVDYAYDRIGRLIADRRQHGQLLNRGPLEYEDVIAIVEYVKTLPGNRRRQDRLYGDEPRRRDGLQDRVRISRRAGHDRQRAGGARIPAAAARRDRAHQPDDRPPGRREFVDAGDREGPRAGSPRMWPRRGSAPSRRRSSCKAATATSCRAFSGSATIFWSKPARTAQWATYEHDVHGFVYVQRNPDGAYAPDAVQVQAVQGLDRLLRRPYEEALTRTGAALQNFTLADTRRKTAAPSLARAGSIRLRPR